MQLANSTSTSSSRAFYLHYDAIIYITIAYLSKFQFYWLESVRLPRFINTILYVHYVHVETRIEGTVIDQESNTPIA